MCKLTLFLINIIPFRNLRNNLMEHHISRCSAGAQALDSSLKESYIHLKTWADSEESLWPDVRRIIRSEASSPDYLPGKRRPVWGLRWMPAGAALLLAAGLIICISRLPVDLSTTADSSSKIGSSRIQVKYGSVNGERAEPFVFQTDKASFVWYGTGRSGG
jgi:hypothetical protein